MSAEALVISAFGLAIVAVLLLVITSNSSEPTSARRFDDMARQIERLSYEFDRKISQATYAQERMASEVVESVQNAVSTLSPEHRGRSESLRLTREISHSLGTPFAGIKAEVRVLEAEDGSDSHRVSFRLERIRTAIDLCQAFVLAYRNLGAVDERTTFLADVRLPEAITRALDFYAAQQGSDVEAAVAMPDAFAGYSNYQILSAILPLLENAVEGTVDGRVAVEHRREERFDVVQISNAFSGGLAEGFLDDDVTGKGGNHEGLGISVSRRLVESMGGALSAESVDQQIRVRISIPVKARS